MALEARRLYGALMFWSRLKVFLVLSDAGSTSYVIGGLKVLIYYIYVSLRLGNQDLSASLGHNISTGQGIMSQNVTGPAAHQTLLYSEEVFSHLL